MNSSDHPYAHPRWARLRPLRGRELRAERALASRAVRDALVSGAGLIGRPVRNQAGEEVGKLVDIVFNFSAAGEHEPYPPATGLVVRVGRRRTWVGAGQIGQVTHGEVRLASARLDLRDVVRRPGEVGLAADVLDHQLIDVDGKRVIRASDALLAPLRDELRIVGVDVSVVSLLRRLGPARARTRPTPDRVIDWAAIQTLGDEEPATGVRMRASSQALQALRPGELADLIEQLGRNERRRLLDSLDTATAADAVEEMEPEDVRMLLHDAELSDAVELLGEMEPDEAVDALRDMPEAKRLALLTAMPAELARRLGDLLGYDEDRAGGVMTTTLVRCAEDDTVAQVIEQLRELAAHAVDLFGIAVVDGEGRLLDDVTALELLLADPLAPISELVGPPWPVTVSPDTPLSEVARQLAENRSASVVVVDAEGRPLGRVLADDLLDSLVPDRSRFQFFRQAP
jgi:CBS domain-containing protein